MFRLSVLFLLLTSAALGAQASSFGRPSSSRASRLDVSKEPSVTIEGIRRATDRVIDYGEGSRTLYAFIGASPLIVAADMESRLGREKVVKIPLSYAPFLREPTVPLEALDRVMFPYLDYFLGSYDFDRIDQIVLVDFAFTGNSLIGAGLLMDRYFLSRRWQNTVVRTAAMRAGSSVNNKYFSLIVWIPTKINDQFYRREFNYLRLFEKETVHQWVNWSGTQKFFDDADLAQKVAEKLSSQRFQDGEERYKRAVKFFSQHPRPKNTAQQIINYCSNLLQRDSATER